MAFGKTRSELQIHVDESIEVLKNVLVTIPDLINQEYAKQELKVRKLAERCEKELQDTKEGDKEIERSIFWSQHESEFDIHYMSIKDDLISVFKESMVLVIQSFYERTLSRFVIESEKWADWEGTDGNSNSAKYLREIKSNLRLKDFKNDSTAGQIYYNFTRLRNRIAHENENHEIPNNHITKELLLNTLNQMHAVLRELADEISKNQTTKFSEQK